jgi:MFS family permease
MLRPIARVYREAFSGLPREIWLLSLITLVNRAGTMVLPFFALFLIRDRSMGIAEAGQVVALYGVGSIAGSFLGGWLSDRFGSIRAQQFSLISAAVGFLAILQADTIFALAVVVLLTSVAAEGFRPAVMTSIAHRAPAGLQARSFALLRLAINLGMAVGPAAGGMLAMHSYSLLFVVDAATSIAAALLLTWMVRSRVPAGAPHEPRPAATARSPWSDTPFLLLTVVVAAMAACLFQAFSTLPIYLRQGYGVRESGIGLVLALNATLIVLFEMVFTHWAEKRNRLVLIGLGGFLVCAGLAILPLGSTVAWAVLSTVIWTAGGMLMLPLTNTLVAERAAGGRRGSYMGLYTMGFSVAFVIAPLGGTWVYEHLSPETLWFGVGGLGVVLFLAAVALIGPFREPGAGASGGDPSSAR